MVRIENFVYPGQPLVVALQVMEMFESWSAASARTEHGWPAALSHSGVGGAGCAVYNALELLKRIQAGLKTEEAVVVSREMWRRYVGHQDSYKDRVQPGLDAQLELEPKFVEKAKVWSW